MTLKTVSGSSIRAALADARRIFGNDVLLLESTQAAGDDPARVTVAFDDAPAPPQRARKANRRSAKQPVARTDTTTHWVDLLDAQPMSTPLPARPYGYGASTKSRNIPPPEPEAVSVSDPAESSELEQLRKRIADLELALKRRPDRQQNQDTLVLVGPAGAGKTSMALRVAQQPHILGASCPAVLLLRTDELSPDPMTLFWSAGVPVAKICSAKDAAQAMIDFADADLLIIDTPSMPLRPEKAHDFVTMLGKALAPLAPLDVHMVIDATRSLVGFNHETLPSLGLHPDALALSRLDEAVSTAQDDWSEALQLPLRMCSSGPHDADVTLARPSAAIANDLPRSATLSATPILADVTAR